MNDKRKLYSKRFDVRLNFLCKMIYFTSILVSQKLVDERDMKWKSLVLEEIENNVDEMQRYDYHMQ